MVDAMLVSRLLSNKKPHCLLICNTITAPNLADHMQSGHWRSVRIKVATQFAVSFTATLTGPSV